MGQTYSTNTSFSSLSYSPVVEGKKYFRSEDQPLYNTPIYTRPSGNHVFTSPRTKPLPRGFQIMAHSTVHLERGFPFPKQVLMCYAIDKGDWDRFKQALNAAFMVSLGTREDKMPGPRIAYNIDKLLDVVAEWDLSFFRPKGLVMRMDVPGEEKYGLDFMDIFYKDHIINLSGTGGREGMIEEYKKGKPVKRRQKHLDKARGRGYCSTRLVLDPVEVLQKTDVANARGWTRWIRMGEEAKRRKARPLQPLKPNEPFAGDARLRLRARQDRWPPSKHFYYERFRGKEDHVPTAHYAVYSQYDVSVTYWGHSRECKWIPDQDAMDQRSGGALKRSTILPADDLPYAVVDDESAINVASLMTRAFSGNGGRDGPPATVHWLASFKESVAANELTCPWPDFPWRQGQETERLDTTDGCEACHQ